ncbi:hypothetical protein [Castellaniella sp. UC4442_H9]
MTSLFCIRDAGGVRRYRTYDSREAAERAIDASVGPGCREPMSVVEFVEATPVVRAADELLHACEMMWAASNGGYPQAFMAIQTAVAHATGERL